MSDPLVSVVIPTLRRPQGLSRAVASVLAQDLDGPGSIEVVIAISDSGQADDVATAERLAGDPRVRVAHAAGRGAGAARNAGIAIARGALLAFMDDDCVAQPGWLRAAVDSMEDADIVQGSTFPAAQVPAFYHSVHAEPPTWRWETCNLLVRRDTVERFGGFDETWNAEGRVGAQHGEDIEWGWRLVRHGARPAFATDAIVLHEVQPRGMAGYVRFNIMHSDIPKLLRTTPEARRAYYRGYFFDRRHAIITASLAAGVAAIVARAAGRPRASAAMGMLAAAGLASHSDYRRALRTAGFRALTEGVQYGSLVYGSLRWRRILL
ncbi:MAG: glycosyltransferase family 2 protein [Candidatus Dormibacteraeota bacterium]|nr:glycosyltransferase family 2 protein [Candidatus Dormibacteraeota bacterium]